MSKSDLVTYTNITQWRTSPREAAIDTIAIHCMAAQWTAKTCADYFARTDRKCSSNLCVGCDGSIAMSVPEEDRSWCTSSRAVDRRAVTIEVASTPSGDFVYPAAYEALIKLCADVCRRNGIKKLVWGKTKEERKSWANGANMQVHCDWDDKACPGSYLLSRMPEIARRVNELLSGAAESVPATETDNEEGVCTVQVRMIGQGDEGNDVFLWQSYLKGKGYSVGTLDGDFGTKTEAATKKWQSNNGLTADGIVGPASWGKALSK